MKHNLQKQFRVPLWGAAVHFGSAVESGVDLILGGKPLEEAVARFEKEWHTKPSNKWNEQMAIFDSTDVFYYTADYDKNLFTPEDEEQFAAWIVDIYGAGEGLPHWEVIIKDVQKNINDKISVEALDRKFFNRVNWVAHQRRGALLIQAFTEQIYPQIEEVIAIQKAIEITNADGDRITGYVDYIVKLKGIDDLVILDLKTAGKLYEIHNIETSDQLRLYAAAENILNIGYMVLFKKIAWDKTAACNTCGGNRENNRLSNCAVKTCKGKYVVSASKPKVIAQLLVKHLETDEVTDVLDDASDIIAAINNEIMWKNPNSCFDFGTRCEYYDVCWGKKTIDDIKKEHDK